MIVQAAGHKADSATDLSKAVTEAKTAGHKDVLLLVAHDGQHIYVPLRVDPTAG